MTLFGIMSCLISAICPAASDGGRLESVEDGLAISDLHRAYYALATEELLVRNAVVQYLSLPGGAGTGVDELGISIAPLGGNKAPPFLLTVKRSSNSLWEQVLQKDRGGKANVKVSARSVPVPASIATAVHQAWLKMILHAARVRDNHVYLDSTSEILSARTPGGRMVRARFPTAMLVGNAKSLFEIAGRLENASRASEPGRAREFGRVEHLANAIAESL